MGAEQATVFERARRRDADVSVIREVEDRWRSSACDDHFDLAVVNFLPQAPLWLP